MKTHSITIPASILADLYHAAVNMRGTADYLAPEKFDNDEHAEEFDSALTTAKQAIEAAKPFHALAVSPPAPREPGTLPPDPEGQNDDRAGWALHAVEAFTELTGVDDEDAIGDLIADIQHLCDREPERFGDFEENVRRASSHYDEETADYGADEEPEDESPEPAAAAPARRTCYAVKITGKGYLAEQGTAQWFESEAVGWALLTTGDHADRMLARYLEHNPTEGGEVIEIP